MLEEAVEVIRALWTGEVTSHHGRHYTVENARIYTLPEPLPPIHVAGSAERMATLAGADRRRLHRHGARRGGRRRLSQGGRRRTSLRTGDGLLGRGRGGGTADGARVVADGGDPRQRARRSWRCRGLRGRSPRSSTRRRSPRRSVRPGHAADPGCDRRVRRRRLRPRVPAPGRAGPARLPRLRRERAAAGVRPRAGFGRSHGAVTEEPPWRRPKLAPESSPDRHARGDARRRRRRARDAARGPCRGRGLPGVRPLGASDADRVRRRARRRRAGCWWASSPAIARTSRARRSSGRPADVLDDAPRRGRDRSRAAHSSPTSSSTSSGARRPAASGGSTSGRTVSRSGPACPGWRASSRWSSRERSSCSGPPRRRRSSAQRSGSPGITAGRSSPTSRRSCVATIHPSAILRSTDRAARDAAMAGFVADLRIAAQA